MRDETIARRIRAIEQDLVRVWAALLVLELKRK